MYSGMMDLIIVFRTSFSRFGDFFDKKSAKMPIIVSISSLDFAFSFSIKIFDDEVL